MAFDAFVKIDGIDGESSDDKHPRWMEIITLDTGLDQKKSSTASSAGGAGAGRADFKPFSFSKLVDTATPALALACADGTHIDTIVIELCRAGGGKLKFMEYKLSNCLITGVYTAGGPGELPAEIISLSYGKVEWRYTKQNRSGGGAAGQVATGWRLERNSRL
jgi:type VI secretion system secreted protein Hcp